MPNDPVADIRALEALEPAGGPTAPSPPEWPTAIQARYFPARRGGHNAYVSNPVEVEKLTKVERRILELLSIVDCGANWAHAGLPPDVRSRRRLVGLDPPGVMEELVACTAVGKGKHPRWKVLKRALDKYGRAYGNKSQPPPTQAWITKHYFTLSPAAWLELWTAVKARSYGIVTAWGDPFESALAAVSKAERVAWAARWSEEILCSPERRLRDWVGGAIVASFVSSGEAVPPLVSKMMKMKAAPEPKPKPKPVEKKVEPGKYVFFGRKGYDLDDVEALEAPAKKQFLVAAKKYGGKEFRTPKAFFTWEAKETETSIDGVGVVHFRISLAASKKKPLYEMWVFLVDNGTVFELGSARPVGVAMFQGRFVVEDKRPELEELARQLQANVPF